MPIQFDSQFAEIAIILSIATLTGIIGRWLKQPLIVSFIAIGIIAGPSVLGIVSMFDEIYLLAEMGIAILLFAVGLKLDVRLIKNMGIVSLATGMGQVLFTSFFGYFIAIALGFDMVQAIYIAVALTFSSTIIIVKLLSDKEEIDLLHGKIALGFLIVQDIVVVIAMIVLTSFGAGQQAEGVWGEVAIVVLKGLAMIAGIILLMYFVIPKFVRSLAKSPELLILFSISWAIALAAFSDYIGFSMEVGAFLAGISLASTPFRENIGSRLVSVRDFFLLFFFIHLGSQLDIAILGEKLVPGLILSAFVLIGNPLIVMIIMGSMGYRKRTGFYAGLTVAQISEFSLILVALGLSLGHVSEDIMALVTLVGLVTIGLSTYMILYSQNIYKVLSPYLDIFEKKKLAKSEHQFDNQKEEIIDVFILGLGRLGWHLIQNLEQKGIKCKGIDFDPDVVSLLKAKGFNVTYGDAEEPELLKELPVKGSKAFICSVPDLYTNTTVISNLRSAGYKGMILLTAHKDDIARELESYNPDLIIKPFTISSDFISDDMLNYLQSKKQKKS